MGTPNKYTKDYAQKALDILSTGKSLASVCAKFSIARSTLYEWRDNHPEFREAIECGLQKSQEYWENIGEDGIKGNLEKFGGTAWLFTMKSRFRADYADPKEEKKESESSVLEKILSGELKVKT
jgi:Zn ribbon nucleic-acid-binding protein